jgi:hypothetical protein
MAEVFASVEPQDDSRHRAVACPYPAADWDDGGSNPLDNVGRHQKYTRRTKSGRATKRKN